MAKGKNAAALFEVIGKSKGIKPAAPRGGLSTPRWWFKGSKVADAVAVAAQPVPEPVKTVPPPQNPPATVLKSDRSRLGPMTALRTPAAAAEPVKVAAAAPSATPAHHVNASALSAASLNDSTTTPIRPVEVDPDQQVIRLRLSYTSAAVVAIALLATVTVAVIIGRSWGAGGGADVQQSTTDLLAGPPRPSVLQATPGQGKLDFIDADPAGLGSAPRTPQTAEGGMAARTGSDARQASDVTPGTGAAGTGPAVATGPAARVVGINYFIVQSYPEERDARAVVDLLARNGVATSIERNLPGYPRWHIVVTNQGFTSLRAPEAEALRRKIDQISADQARADRRWKPLTPQGYRWR